METISENLMAGLLRQINRNRELANEYDAIGPVGIFGATFIRQKIADAEHAIASGDIVAMVQSYKDLEDSK